MLRQFAEQITPRGDTVVIRTYGDSMDANGNIVARAWCEVIVQRVSDYLDAANADHLRASQLQLESNKRFGRSFRVVSFRWLNPS